MGVFLSAFRSSSHIKDISSLWYKSQILLSSSSSTFWLSSQCFCHTEVFVCFSVCFFLPWLCFEDHCFFHIFWNFMTIKIVVYLFSFILRHLENFSYKKMNVHQFQEVCLYYVFKYFISFVFSFVFLELLKFIENMCCRGTEEMPNGHSQETLSSWDQCGNKPLLQPLPSPGTLWFLPL